MWHAARRHEDAALADAMLLAVDVDEDLALKHVEHLVIVGMQVQRRRLAEYFAILEQRERAGGFR